MQFRRSKKLAVAINIAPLVDVVFLLVIFFAVSTTFLETGGLKLELPTSSSTATREAEQVTVLLAADGGITLSGETLDSDELTTRLRGLLEETDDRVVTLRADTRTSHGDVVKVMDAIRSAGAEGLTVAARATN